MRRAPPFLALSMVVGLLAAMACGARAETVRVTTDSLEYCTILAQRLAMTPQGDAEPARTLGEEGRRLCDGGHVRTGIARLRRALRAAGNTGP